MHVRSHILVVALALALSSAACTTNSGAVDELHRHTEAITALIEKHQNDPAAAIKAIEDYEQEHRDAIEDLVRRSRKIRADLGQRSKRKLKARWDSSTVDLRKRLEKLAEGSK